MDLGIVLIFVIAICVGSSNVIFYFNKFKLSIYLLLWSLFFCSCLIMYDMSIIKNSIGNKTILLDCKKGEK